MPYNQNIPTGTGIPRYEYQGIASNFLALNTDFAVDHIPYTADEDMGEHKKVTFNDVAADPGLGFPKTSSYTKIVTVGAVDYYELFFETSRDPGANIVRQLTGIDPVVVGSNYSMMTPWGARIAWGTCAMGPAGVAVAFSVAFASVQCLILSTNSNNPNHSSTYSGLGVAGFTAWCTNNLTGSYIAIGT